MTHIGVGTLCPPKIAWVGWGQGSIFFGNDLPMNDLPYSKGFIKFDCLKPSKIVFDF